MFSKISIKTKVLILSLLMIFIVAFIIAANSIYSINKFSEDEIKKFEKVSYAKKKEELEHYISLAMKTVEDYEKNTSIEKVKIEVEDELKKQTNFLFSILEAEYNSLKDTLSQDALEYRLKSIINATRYGKTGYFWVNDTEANIVVHPIKPSLNGKDLSNFEDKNGKKIFSEFAKVAKKNGEGFVDYAWPKPGFDKPQLKVSYVKLFKPFNWVVGTGEYVSDVSSKVKEQAKEAVKNMRYSKTGYFWINDSNHKVVMHPIKESFVGKDMGELKDKNGVYVYKEIVKVANANPKGGIVKYIWDKPGKDKPQPKYAYVQRFAPWDWIIGTGVYVDDIEEEITIMKSNTKKEINSVIINILLYTLGSIIILYLIYSFLIKKIIIKPLEDLNGAILNIKDNSNSIDKIDKVSDDEIGKVVDSFNEYIGNLKDGYEEDARVIEEVDSVIEKVNNGFYVYKVEKSSSNPQIMRLRDSLNSMIDKTNDNLMIFNNLLTEYGSSNYKINSSHTKILEAGAVFSALGARTLLVGHNISEFLSMIVQSGKKLNEDTDILSTSANKLSTSANEQAASLEETAAAIEQITSIVKSNVQNVTQMSSLANELHDSSKNGEQLASRTTQAMDDIDEQVNSINEAITVIDQIAFQTNILSLNAAVEAATAGEAGKGFAVVAQEVRNLASRSAEAAKEIKDLVENATQKANEGKSIANNMITGYTDLNTRINQTIELIENVSQASKEEEKGIVQINDSINALDQATQVNANSATIISNLSTEVSQLSETLINVADRANFDLSNSEAIKDIDLVFEVSRLKNEHIIFKVNAMGKLVSKECPRVENVSDTPIGKWISQEEIEGKNYTKTSNWNSLKDSVNVAHTKIQEYYDEQYSSNPREEVLAKLTHDVDMASNQFFQALEQLKIDNKVEKEEVVNVEVKQTQVTEQKPKQPEYKQKERKENITISSNVSDDEWESF